MWGDCWVIPQNKKEYEIAISPKWNHCSFDSVNEIFFTWNSLIRENKFIDGKVFIVFILFLSAKYVFFFYFRNANRTPTIYSWAICAEQEQNFLCLLKLSTKHDNFVNFCGAFWLSRIYSSLSKLRSLKNIRKQLKNCCITINCIERRRTIYKSAFFYRA